MLASSIDNLPLKISLNALFARVSGDVPPGMVKMQMRSVRSCEEGFRRTINIASRPKDEPFHEAFAVGLKQDLFDQDTGFVLVWKL